MRNNKADFRDELYKLYVSTFKSYISDDSEIRNTSIFKGYNRSYLRLIDNYSRDASIIDVGCGNGLMLQFLKYKGFTNLYGIDISEQQVAQARKKGLNADVISVFEFFKNNKKKFDVIFAMDLVEHFYKYELIELFNGFNSILSDNGMLIIHTPNGDGIFHQHIIYGDLTHLTIFNSNSLGQILRLTGFNDIKCFETGPTTKNFIGVIRLILWKFIRIIVQAVRIIETGGTEKILTQDFLCVAKNSKNKDNT